MDWKFSFAMILLIMSLKKAATPPSFFIELMLNVTHRASRPDQKLSVRWPWSTFSLTVTIKHTYTRTIIKKPTRTNIPSPKSCSTPITYLNTWSHSQPNSIGSLDRLRTPETIYTQTYYAPLNWVSPLSINCSTQTAISTQTGYFREITYVCIAISIFFFTFVEYKKMIMLSIHHIHAHHHPCLQR